MLLLLAHRDSSFNFRLKAAIIRMLLITQTEIDQLISPPELLCLMEDALIQAETQECYVPERMHLEHEGKIYLLMPSFTYDYYATKLVSVVRSNNTKQLPVTNGVIVLHDGITGMPLSLLNAASITASRTGAVGALGVKYMTDEKSDSIGLIGHGVQGTQQALFAAFVRPLRKIFCLKHSEEGFMKFVKTIHDRFPHMVVVPCISPEEVIRNTDIVITATTSATPVLPDDEELFKGKHLIAVGSYKKDMRELPDAAFRLSGTIVTDSVFAQYETGDTLIPLKKGLVREENIFTITKLLNKSKSVDIKKTTVYKTAGMALFDLFYARELYSRALKSGKGTIINL